MARSTSSSSVSAREKARKIQQEQERKQRLTSVLLRVGVVVVALAVVAGLTIFVMNRDGGDGVNVTQGEAPGAATEHGGVILTSAADLAEGDGLGQINADELPEAGDEAPAGVGPREEGEPPHLVIYTDPGCPHCASFEAEHHAQLAEWLDEGLITVEYRSVAFMDDASQDNYSSRAVNSFYCMADESPENYGSYLAEVTANQPQGEMSNDELSELASTNYDADISECVEGGEYRAFTTYSSRLGSAEESVSGTPSVWIDDVEWATTERPFREVVEEVIEEYQSEAGEGSEDGDGEG